MAKIKSITSTIAILITGGVAAALIWMGWGTFLICFYVNLAMDIESVYYWAIGILGI